MSREEWRPVPAAPGYEASDQGRIRSVDRVYVDAMGRHQHRKGVVLRESAVGEEGRPYVSLGRGRHRLVYRLVLEAFVGPCPDGMEACHGDGNHRNNRLDNLRWDTRGANMLDAVRHGTHVNARRETCPRNHPLKAPNLVPSAARDNHRECLACSRAQGVKKRAAAKGLEIDFQTVSDRYYAELISETGEAA
jgi:hypothetical protein